MPGTKMWLILGVSLTHLVKNRDLFLLEVEIVDNISMECIKNMRHINLWWHVLDDKGFDSKILNTRIVSHNSCNMKAFSCFLSNALI